MDSVQKRQMMTALYSKVDEYVGQNGKHESMNLLKCLQTYRACPCIETLLANKPELVGQLDDIYQLWRKFDRMSQEELAELAIQLIDSTL